MPTFLQRLGHVALRDAQREAFHHGGLTDARFAHQDGIVLAAAREDIDHLADFEIAAQHRVDLALPGVFREVDGVLVEVRSLAAGLGLLAFRRRRSRPRRTVRLSSSDCATMFGEILAQRFGIDLLEFLADSPLCRESLPQ